MTKLNTLTTLLLSTLLAASAVSSVSARGANSARTGTGPDSLEHGSAFCEIGLGAVPFANETLTRAFLGRRDEWAKSLSAYDLGARQATTDPTDVGEFLKFAPDHARDWTAEEVEQWQPLVDDLDAALIGLKVKIPVAFMSKTTGEEELNANAYTRERTVFFNGDLASLPSTNPRAAFRLLAHEFFHIASRNDPAIRDALYELIGFHGIDGFEYPPSLEERRVTNPDAFRYNYAITVDSPDGLVDVVVIIQQSVPLEDVIGNNFFATISFRLVAVDPESGVPLDDGNGHPVLYHFGNTDYIPRTLRNTDFIIAADEILAENFATLMEWRKDGVLPPDSGGFAINDQQLLEDIEATLALGCD